MTLTPRHIAIVLGVLFGLYQCTALLIHLSIERHRRYEHSEAKTKQNSYFTISYSQWKQAKKIKDDEILLNGKMFDVKSINFTEESVILYGHFDQKEDTLLAKAKEHNSRNTDEIKSLKVPLLFFEAFNDSDLPFFNVEPSRETHFFAEATFSIFLSFDSPPPQFV